MPYDPAFIVVNYTTETGHRCYEDVGPALVMTFDYFTFYDAATSLPLALLGYEVLHYYPKGTTLADAQTQFISAYPLKERTV